MGCSEDWGGGWQRRRAEHLSHQIHVFCGATMSLWATDGDVRLWRCAEANHQEDSMSALDTELIQNDYELTTVL